jgi:hypothetical protein
MAWHGNGKLTPGFRRGTGWMAGLLDVQPDESDWTGLDYIRLVHV